MRLQNLFISVVAALLSFIVGAGAGYYVSRNEAGTLNNQRLEITTALRAADLQNRLVMIRILREKGLSSEDIATLEISAISLLQTIDLTEHSPSSDAGYVLRKTAETLSSYRKDFPVSEFDPSKQTSVARLLALLTNRSGASR